MIYFQENHQWFVGLVSQIGSLLQLAEEAVFLHLFHSHVPFCPTSNQGWTAAPTCQQQQEASGSLFFTFRPTSYSLDASWNFVFALYQTISSKATFYKKIQFLGRWMELVAFYSTVEAKKCPQMHIL